MLPADRLALMGIEELKSEWEAHADLVAQNQDWDQRRENAAPMYREALDRFLSDQMGLADFRTRIDVLGKTEPHWGFKGTGQMFFNQLVKAADEADFIDALKASLPAPKDSSEAEKKLNDFTSFVDRARDRAETTGKTKPGRGRVNFFVSFFWELQDREEWPTFFPNSRDVLDQHGLLDTNLPQPALYMAYRAAMQELKQALSTNTWGAEHLLWLLGKGAPEPEPTPATPTGDSPAPADPADRDLYASYRADGLHFPDEVVTSMVLSLATKRFVILSGISGTGKTQIALGLARHLESTATVEPGEVEPPAGDKSNTYVRLTAPKLQRGRSSLPAEVRAAIDGALGLPERGTSKTFTAELPDGSEGKVRLNNLGFSDPSRELFLLFFRKEVNEWLGANARPGDFLHLDLGAKKNGIDLSLDLVQGVATEEGSAPPRHVLVAVRSDWTDPRGLTGYFNPITNTYVRTSVVDLLLRAADDPDHPYLIVLDEMNLARVEYYFSDFLSALESGEPIELMSPGVEEELLALGHDEIPAQLQVPANVSFVGTVNVDETTHSFSPKVLDRANLLEFSSVEVERALGHPVEEMAAGLRLKNGQLAPGWLCTSRGEALEPRAAAQEFDDFTEALEDVHDLLARYHLHFGYRVIDEVSAFVGHALDKVDDEPAEIVRRAFDLQLRQKILPKLSGGRELEEPLALLLKYCLSGEKTKSIEVDAVRSEAEHQLDPSSQTGGSQTPRYPESAEKLLRMLKRIADTGFVGALE